MLGRLSAVLLGIFLAVPINAQAEQFVMPIGLRCDTDANNIIDMVQTKYGEIPFASSQTLVQVVPQGGWLPGVTMQFINPSSGSFSLIMMDENTGAGCLVIAGQKMTVIK
jgi:hypothetical protein